MVISKGVDATLIDATPEIVLNLHKQGFDRVFNILHGTGGEDGIVQAALELQHIPYTGSGVLASALAMDKLRTKRIWKAEDLPTPERSEEHTSERPSLMRISYDVFCLQK